MFNNNGSRIAQEAAEDYALPLAENPRMVALEMAMSLICNREEGSTGADAVDVTRIADVLLEWMNQK